VQIVQGEAWAAAALAQQRTTREIPAPRGRILDREGVPLAETGERVEVGVDPREVPEGRAETVAQGLTEALGIQSRRARAAVASREKWEYLGEYSAAVEGQLKGLPGVYATPTTRREYPQGRMALGVLGGVRDGAGRGGIEQVLNDHLQGEPGRAIVARTPSGEQRDAVVFHSQAPRAGGDVVLTLDADMQAAAKDALKAAVDSTVATGGDLIMTSPQTGEILAAVSIKDGADVGLSFLTEPSEPGSTMKPITLAALLSRGRAELDEPFDTGDGVYRRCSERWADTSPHGVITLEEAVAVSSNVAFGMAAERLDPREQYETLRDFGFGQRTGIGIPGESAGVLRRPEEWSCSSPTALAIGYELSATPLQVVMAYGALANGGLLMEPRIIREIRHRDGRREVVEPRVVRRVLRPRVAREITGVLQGVVESGTGGTARLASFAVAGKSGTARVHDGGYQVRRYFASFVGYFPADDPQVVIYAKLDNVEGYGGRYAGPVIRATMEAALASQGSPLRMARERAPGSAAPRPDTRRASPVRLVSTRGSDTPEPAYMEAPLPPEEVERAWSPNRPVIDVEVPELGGMGLREAARRLHALGLRVAVSGTGRVASSRPRAGVVVQTGDTVLLRTGRGDR
jgi:cell division protein FtsI (penicillin-binding protein 3)